MISDFYLSKTEVTVIIPSVLLYDRSPYAEGTRSWLNDSDHQWCTSIGMTQAFLQMGGGRFTTESSGNMQQKLGKSEKWAGTVKR